MSCELTQGILLLYQRSPGFKGANGKGLILNVVILFKEKNVEDSVESNHSSNIYL